MDIREKLREVISKFDLHLALNKTKGTERWVYSSKMLWGEWVEVAPELLSEFPTVQSIQQENLKDIGLSWKDIQAYQYTVKYTRCLALGHNPPSTLGDEVLSVCALCGEKTATCDCCQARFYVQVDLGVHRATHADLDRRRCTYNSYFESQVSYHYR